MYDIDSLPGLIELGHLNEKGVCKIEFDVTDWLADYPEGVFSITYIRPTETAVYPVAAGDLAVSTVDDAEVLTWMVSDTVTSIAGSGSVVVELKEGTAVKKTTDKILSYTKDGHAAAVDPPEPLADYIEKWSAVDATVTESVPGTAPTAAVTQNNTGTHFVFDLPTDLAAYASATTLDTGLPATAAVTQDGTGAHFVFGLPRGIQGIQGIQGLTGNGVASIIRTTGDGSPGTTDTYTITYTDDTTTTFTVYNGQDYQQDFPASWDEIRNLGRQGKIAQYFQIGDQFAVQSTPYTSIVFNLVDIGSSTSPNTVASDPDYYINFPNATPPVLHMQRVIYGRQFDNTEALYACSAGLSAGTYNFALPAGYDVAYGGSLTYQFTLSNAVPAGGVIMFPWGYNVQASTIQIRSYLTQISTSAIESVAVTAGSDGTALGTADGLTANMNHAQRIRYGSNNWSQSAVRQWLNSAAAANAWWMPQTIFDRPPPYANVAGFLNGLDADFVAILGETDHVTVNNTVTDGGGVTPSYVTRDKIYLPSRTEIFGTDEVGGTPEGEQYPFYVGSVNADCIKYDISSPATARIWWMRSPHVSLANNARYVHTSGALSYHLAFIGLGAAAACVIL